MVVVVVVGELLDEPQAGEVVDVAAVVEVVVVVVVVVVVLDVAGIAWD